MQLCTTNIISSIAVALLACEGSFFTYVDKNFPTIEHLPILVTLVKELLYCYKGKSGFRWLVLSRHVNVVKERPPWLKIFSSYSRTNPILKSWQRFSILWLVDSNAPVIKTASQPPRCIMALSKKGRKKILSCTTYYVHDCTNVNWNLKKPTILNNGWSW